MNQLSDREFAQAINLPLHISIMSDEAAKLIDQHINDIYRAKLNALPNAKDPSAPGHAGCQGYFAHQALDDIPKNFWAAIGRAIRDNRPEEVGMLVIAGVTKALREQAEDEAEA